MTEDPETLESPPRELVVWELIPPTPCTVCGVVLKYATPDQRDGHSHRVLAGYSPDFGLPGKPRPVEPRSDGRPHLHPVRLSETDLPTGTNVRIIGQGHHDAVLIIRRDPPPGPVERLWPDEEGQRWVPRKES